MAKTMMPRLELVDATTGPRDERRWQWREDEASQAPRDHHGAECPCDGPEQNMNLSRE